MAGNKQLMFIACTVYGKANLLTGHDFILQLILMLPMQSTHLMQLLNRKKEKIN